MRLQFKHLILSGIIFISFAAVHADGFFDDMNLSGTFETDYWNHDPNWTMGEDDIYDGPYTSLENTLSLNLDWNSWFAELRLRSMNYDDQIYYDPESREYETEFEIFKYAAGYRGSHFDILAGDFYKSLAHGIVLFVQEDEELNLDRTIRGGNVNIKTSPVDINFFGGNVYWYKFKDRLSTLTIDEYKIRDQVFGGRVESHLPYQIIIGANIVSSKIFEIIRDEYENEELVLGSVDFGMNGVFNGLIDFYAEYAEMQWDSDEPFGAIREDGEAFYSSATLYKGPFTVLLEYKDYDYWDFRYSRPPTADREDELSEIDDIQGPRLKVDYYISASDTLLTMSFSRFDNHKHPDNFGIINRNRVDHIYGEIEQHHERFYAHLTFGYKKYETIEEINRRVTSDFVYYINDRNSLNLFYEYKFTGNDYTEKNEHESYLTYSLSPWLAITGHYNRHVIQEQSREQETEEWFAGELVITPINALNINILFGELPPGLICSGGQCRIVPAFEGIQASLTYRF